MEIKNTTSYTYDVLMEFNRQHKRKLFRAISIIFFVATVAMFAALLANLILCAVGIMELFDVQIQSMAWLYATLSIFLLLFARLHRRKFCRKQAAIHPVDNYVFTQEGFENISTSDTGNVQGQYKYDVIVNVTESDHAFYLYIAPNAAHIVSKDGFTEGTENDFRTLLRTVIEPKKLRIR